MASAERRPPLVPEVPCIDMHVHLHPEGLARAIERWFAEAQWVNAHPFDPDAVADTLAGRGVRRFCFFSYAHRAGMAREVNRWLAATAARLPQAVALGTLHAGDGALDALAREAFEDLGLAGLKLHLSVQRFHVDDPRLFPVYERVEATGRLLMLHVGTLPYRDAYTGVAGFRRLMDRFPRLRVCVAHMGCFEHEAFLALTERFEHLYVDTTMALAPSAAPYVGAEPGGITDATLERYQDRILFGSDFPLIPYDYDEERRWAWDRGLGPEVRRKIFHDNAARFLGLAAADGG